MSSLFLYLVIALLGVGLVYLGKTLLREKKKLKRYSALTDVQGEISNLSSKAKKMKVTFNELSKRYDSLKKEVGDLDDEYALAEYGLYKPRYNFNDSQKYKDELAKTREKQKLMIKNNTAMHCATNWTIGNSAKAGEAMTKKIHKIALNAFNVECDNLIMKVKYNNVDTIDERIYKLADRIEKSLSKWGSKVQSDFIKLKHDELYLVHEYQEKLHQEKEEQRQIKEQMREEEKARKEYEKAQRDAEKEEKQYQQALVKARKEVEKASDEEKSILEEKLKALEVKLAEAHSSKERALSMAQQTKRGHVYVISNIGSFGEHVYKIGMTRRLEPMDRVKELGDASVPFAFDVHAMIFSENAPELEKELHHYFNEKRKNKINLRKEFFNVSLQEIEQFCVEKSLNIEFTQKAEAKEYWETKALIAKIDEAEVKKNDISDLEFDFEEKQAA